MQLGKTIFLKYLTEIHFEVGSSYNNTAYLLPSLGKLDESLEHHLKGLEIRLICYG